MITVKEFKREIATWTKELLKEYLSKLSANNYRPPEQGRDFNDPVWGTITVDAFETIIIDSPLFQRLRRIRQLGVIHLVYPSAHHTRFEHSLGVFHVVQAIIDSLNRSCPSAISPRSQAVLRSAALCHDMGHGAFSHVSESYLLHDREIIDLTSDFAESLNIEKIQFSEMVAISILESNSVSKLFELAAIKSRNLVSGTEILNSIRKCLLSKIFDESAPLLHELITGPFDADKLDYMRRDSHMAGIPSLIDVVRLIKKAKCEKFRIEDISDFPNLQELATSGEITIAAIGHSGARALDELLIGRIMLIDKLYRHQRVRSFEGLVFHLLDSHFEAQLTLKKDKRRPRFMIPIDLTDDSFSHPNAGVGPKWSAYQRVQKRLLDREGYVRTFAVSAAFAGLSPEQSSGITSLLNSMDKSKKRDLLLALADKIDAGLVLLGGSWRKLAGTADNHTFRKLWIDSKDEREHSAKANRAWIISEGRVLNTYENLSKEAPKWASAYLQRKDVAYLFADRSISQVAHLAFEAIIAERFKVLSTFSQSDFIKLAHAQLGCLRDELIGKRFYAKVQFSHRVFPRAVQGLLNSGKIAQVVSRLQGYSSPPSGAKIGEFSKIDDNSNSLTNHRVALWLSQFESEEQIMLAFECFGNITLIGRSHIAQALQSFRKTNAGFEQAVVVALGSAEDGANSVAYSAADIGIRIDTVENVLDGDNPIIFVDDFIGLGNTCDNHLSNLLGHFPEHNLNQSKIRPLSPDNCEKLKNRSLGFVFSAGWSKGEELLYSAIKRLELDGVCHIEVRDSDIPSISSVLDAPSLKKFKKKNTEIGASLLSKRGWNAKKISERILGYGNQGLLVVTPLNTPTQSLTALWASGLYKDLDWQPILRRREK